MVIKVDKSNDTEAERVEEKRVNKEKRNSGSRKKKKGKKKLNGVRVVSLYPVI